MNLAVLVSGSGTILAAMIKKKVPIALVMADRKCKGLEIAKNHEIPTVLIDRMSGTFDRDLFSDEVAKELHKHHIGLVALTGYMTILSQPYFDRFKGITLNTHPALLPSFPGAHACKDALASGVKLSGCTIHKVTIKVDEGEILAQAAVPVFTEDTEESLQERIKRKERKLYPQVLMNLI